MKREFVLPIGRCPACGAQGTCEFRGIINDIPHFGETMESLVSCSRCKFKHADVMQLGEKEPVRYEFKICSEDDMMVRVIRSSTGAISLPELGVTVRPGPSSEGYISNVEGVLNRVEDVVRISVKKADPTRQRNAKIKLKKIDEIKQGKFRAKLIIMDPCGHSVIVDKRAKKRKLTKKEIAELEIT